MDIGGKSADLFLFFLFGEGLIGPPAVKARSLDRLYPLSDRHCALIEGGVAEDLFAGNPGRLDGGSYRYGHPV